MRPPLALLCVAAIARAAAEAPPAEHCKGTCGQFSAAGACWCDEDCDMFGNCCADACSACGFGCDEDGDSGCGVLRPRERGAGGDGGGSTIELHLDEAGGLRVDVELPPSRPRAAVPAANYAPGDRHARRGAAFFHAVRRRK